MLQYRAIFFSIQSNSYATTPIEYIIPVSQFSILDHRALPDRPRAKNHEARSAFGLEDGQSFDINAMELAEFLDEWLG